MADHRHCDTRHCILRLDPRPTVPGTVLLCPSESERASDQGILHTDRDAFESVLCCAREVARLQHDKLHVRRSGLICEGVIGAQGEYGKVIPLYGLAESWQEVAAYGGVDEVDVGRVHTREGPRALDDQLTALQSRILAAQPSKTISMDLTFHGDASDDSLFARIVRGEEPAWRIWESTTHIAFLTPFPNTPGFTVVIPRAHLKSDVLGLPDEEFFALMHAAREVAALLQVALGLPSCSLAVEGMGVDYAHVKVIPLHADSIESARRLRLNPQASVMEAPWPDGGTYTGYITSVLGPPLNARAFADLKTLLNLEGL